MDSTPARQIPLRSLLSWLLLALAFTLLLESPTLSGTWPLALAPQPAIHA